MDVCATQVGMFSEAAISSTLHHESLQCNRLGLFSTEYLLHGRMSLASKMLLAVHQLHKKKINYSGTSNSQCSLQGNLGSRFLL